MKLVNKSDWPDWFVQPLFRWLWRNLNRKDQHAPNYMFTLRAPSPQRDIHGRAGRASGFMRMGRRSLDAVKHLRRDNRYAWAPEYDLRTHVEAFVFLAAHELRHGHKDNQWLSATGSAQGAEYDANHWAWQQVEAFRAEWPFMRARILAKVRRQRAETAMSKQRKAEKRAAKNAPEAKLAHILDLQKAWQTKMKRANTRLKQLRRREVALRWVINQRSAARSARGE